MGQMVGSLEDVQIDISVIRRTQNIVPAGWQDLHRSAPCGPAKKKMTIRLDAEVLDWYRSLGGGYQARMNAVLKAYMHSILSKHIRHGDDYDWLNIEASKPIRRS
jgi:hypothetical protein